MKNILPALGNEFIVLIKETSVAGVIAVTDLNKSSAVHWFYRLHCIAAVVCSSRLLSCDRVRTYKIAEFIGKEVVTR